MSQDSLEEVGSRELRINLKKYLKKVERGEEIIITSNGEKICKIIPYSQTGEYRVRAVAYKNNKPVEEEYYTSDF